jgi:DNA-binding MarR family transcriptional regulator
MSTRKHLPVSAPDDADRGPLLGALLRLCHQAVITEVIRGLGEAGYPDIQSPHAAALRPLWDHPEGARSTELAASARITKQSMGAIVDQLAERGYVERVDDPSDKRAKLVRLTKRGRGASGMMRAVVRRVEADWAGRIGAARLEALRETLTQLLASLDGDA